LIKSNLKAKGLLRIKKKSKSTNENKNDKNNHPLAAQLSKRKEQVKRQ